MLIKIIITLFFFISIDFLPVIPVFLNNSTEHTIEYPLASVFKKRFISVINPDNPVEPVVTLDNKEIQKNNNIFPVIIRFSDGTEKQGSIHFSKNSISFSLIKNNKVHKSTEVLNNIDSIEFTKWRGQSIDNKSYIFYPVKIIIIFKNRSVLEIDNNIQELNKLTLTEGENKRFFYTYFYDYRKNNKWRNSKKEDIHYPETHPHAKTVVKIFFREIK